MAGIGDRHACETVKVQAGLEDPLLRVAIRRRVVWNVFGKSGLNLSFNHTPTRRGQCSTCHVLETVYFMRGTWKRPRLNLSIKFVGKPNDAKPVLGV